MERGRHDSLEINLRSLDIFVLVAECGGISQAARRAQLTQSAVSQIIANLEQSIGVQLLDRQVRPIALTPSGAVLLDKARGVLLAAREAIQAARAPVMAALPKLNIGLVDTLAGTIGLDLVSSLRSIAALWSVQIGLHSQHRRALLAREVDIIISPDPLEDQPNLERYRILREPLLLAVPRGVDPDIADLGALARERDIVRLSSRTMLGREVDRLLRRLRIEAAGRAEFDDSETVLAMVASGLGWTIVTPLCMLRGQAFWPSVTFAPLPSVIAFREVHVLARERELGDIPRQVAHTAKAAIARRMSEEIAPNYPWIMEMLTLPGISVVKPEETPERWRASAS
ncbi:LysR family transcriptional regulator [Rhodomicrobium vannielii ATCC 17100]|uniref:LysR family transcriptional regulator n=1 Tax=Rhodomicrobium udaipurense TaxID=1202716 RepID=A0A8I1G881_9HYPH|nr:MULTISPECIES: LysR family transcriptional regulator [Rhodomicrobium]KAI93449.1 LysR family transcriptional regulator [Rhodomicrobium udaipurense JA643]MBJ7533816.1 LysR family transcriptional regulator [Rhodomicrobium vannielii ATCC 17100]MBJ7542357.1 LysR family transcriptional regulator [Rhodomicrobium udaipurense]